MKRMIAITAAVIVLNCSAVLSAQAVTFNTTPLNYNGQPVSTQPVITSGFRNTTISSTINPGATSIRSTTLQLHPNYVPPVPTPVITNGGFRNTTISSTINPGATSIVATTLQLHPNYVPPAPTINTFRAIGAPVVRIPEPTFGMAEGVGDEMTPGPGGSAGYPYAGVADYGGFLNFGW
jgi:hypothetical protein